MAIVNAPHYAVQRFKVLERQLTRQTLPQNNAPTVDVAFLRVRSALEHFGRHPSGAALVVGHHRRLNGDRAKVADFQQTTAVDEQQIW